MTNTEAREIRVNGLPVQVVRKAIRNLHLGVYPPLGRVRVAAPLALGDDAVRLAVAGKLGWIRRQQARFAAQSRESEREMVSGESHYVLGRRYRLRVIEHDGPGQVAIRGRSVLELRVPSGLDARQRERVLQRWYRQRLRELIAPAVAKWERVLDVHAAGWGIKSMKTKWGACSVDARWIWLNLELAKKPPRCLDYIVVHELAHLVERRHGDAFVAIMDRHLPNWRLHQRTLNAEPLGHQAWTY